MAKRTYWQNVAALPAPAKVAGGLVGLGLLWWLLSPAEGSQIPTQSGPTQSGPAPRPPLFPVPPQAGLPPGAVVVPTPTPAAQGGWASTFPETAAAWAAIQAAAAQAQAQGVQTPQAPPVVENFQRPRPLGNPLQLALGRIYRARIELSALEALAATRERVAQAFVDLGFRGVVAYQNAAELDASWPPEARAGATDRTRWVLGTWTGAPTSIARPSSVVAAWEG